MNKGKLALIAGIMTVAFTLAANDNTFAQTSDKNLLATTKPKTEMVAESKKVPVAPLYKQNYTHLETKFYASDQSKQQNGFVVVYYGQDKNKAEEIWTGANKALGEGEPVCELALASPKDHKHNVLYLYYKGSKASEIESVEDMNAEKVAQFIKDAHEHLAINSNNHTTTFAVY